MNDQNHNHPVVLQLSQFSVSYGAVEAVHGVNLEVRRGEIVTVIGPNGRQDDAAVCRDGFVAVERGAPV